MLLVAAFNTVDRGELLHYSNLICPSIATSIHNCYFKPSLLFVIGRAEISSLESVIQEDPAPMTVYAITITPLILILEITNQYLHGTSDDLTAPCDLKQMILQQQVKGIKY